jgi:hypothetical protein
MRSKFVNPPPRTVDGTCPARHNRPVVLEAPQYAVHGAGLDAEAMATELAIELVAVGRAAIEKQ